MAKTRGYWQHPTDPEEMRNLCVRLTGDQLRGLERLAKSEGSNRSDVLRRALRRELKRSGSAGGD